MTVEAVVTAHNESVQTYNGLAIATQLGRVKTQEAVQLLWNLVSDQQATQEAMVDLLKAQQRTIEALKR